MTRPLAHISPQRRIQYFYPLLVATLLIMVIMNIAGSPLKTAAAPQGIISFEFAASPARAQQMIDSWDVRALTSAGFVQGLDFLFPLVYSSAIALGSIMAGSALQARRQPLAGLGNIMAWGVSLAAFLDYIENIALVRLLLSPVASPWPLVAAVCAAIKFLLIFLALVYALYGWIMRLLQS